MKPIVVYDKADKWDLKFMELASHVGSWSKDRSRKIGCVIVGPNREIRSTGYNGFPRGVYDDIDSRHQRPAKYLWTEHSERNAIYNAARCGICLEGCTLYTSLFPCADCARGIIQSGITKVVTYEPDWNDPTYKDSFLVVRKMFEEYSLFVDQPILKFIEGASQTQKQI